MLNLILIWLIEICIFRTVVIEIATAEEAISVDLPRTQKIVFSTKDHIMITYEPHVTYGPRVVSSFSFFKTPVIP